MFGGIVHVSDSSQKFQIEKYPKIYSYRSYVAHFNKILLPLKKNLENPLRLQK